MLPIATDPEGAVVVITLTVYPSWISIVGSTLTMIPLSAQIGTNPVTVSITDGLNIVTYTFNVVVINNPPTFASAPADQSVPSGGIVNYILPTISDAENDVIIIALVAPLISLVSITGTTILMNPLPTTSGTFIVSGTLFDGVNTVPFTFNEIVTNLPPYF